MMEPTKEQIEFMKPGKRVMYGGRGRNTYDMMIAAIRNALENPGKKGAILVPSEKAKAAILMQYGPAMPDNLSVVVPTNNGEIK